MCSPAQRCTNFERRVAMATKFCVVAPNIFGSAVLTLLHINVLAPKMFGFPVLTLLHINVLAPKMFG
jgi:hypothetical protein